MKKIVISCCLALAFVSTIVEARPISEETAKQIAQNWMHEKTGRQLMADELTTAFIKKVHSNTVYYIVNFSQGGWAIISGDDVAYPVVAFSYQGAYSTEEHPVQFDQWMENVTSEIHNGIIEKTAPLPTTESAWGRLNISPEHFAANLLSEPATPLQVSTTSAGPLLTTFWSQGTYYNASCPDNDDGYDDHVLTGCVATAMSQVMKYHNYPATGSGSHTYTHDIYGNQTANFSETTYNWASMPNELFDYNSNMAALLFHAGVSVEMNYGPDSSSASSKDVPNALITYFKYSDKLYYATKADYTESEWQALLHTELNNNRPIYYRGTGSGGHAFVCDGFDADDHFHFNWGWSDSSYDGYYYLNDLTPASRNYTLEQGAVIGIAPPEAVNLSYPYYESFENGIPSEYAVNSLHAEVVDDDFHPHYHFESKSLRLSTPNETDFNEDIKAVLNINVPAGGGELSFWVKRGYNSYASAWNQQSARLETQFGGNLLHTFYDGDYIDSEWVQFIQDLTPWAGSNIKLIVQQTVYSSTHYEWTYLDDIEITVSSGNNTPLPLSVINLLLLNKQ